jgi:SHS2 domain-containing protein
MMDENSESGCLELAHTADWSLKVWAPNLLRLFEAAALGMYGLMEIERADNRRTAIPLELEAIDGESLLVAFLNELLYLNEDQGLAFDRFDLVIEHNRIRGILHGAAVKRQRKEIKAVTFHDLEILFLNGRYETTIVFDV